MIADFPSIIMFLNSAKMLAINFMYLVAYIHGLQKVSEKIFSSARKFFNKSLLTQGDNCFTLSVKKRKLFLTLLSC